MDKYEFAELAMRHSDKPCIGEPCDLDSPCNRHNRTVAIVLKIKRLKEKPLQNWPERVKV